MGTVESGEERLYPFLEAFFVAFPALFNMTASKEVLYKAQSEHTV